MGWLGREQDQGLVVLIVVLQLVFTAVQAPWCPRFRSVVGLGERVMRSLLIHVSGWLIYGALWGVLALTMGFPASMVLSPTFFMLGSFSAIGAMSASSPIVGGFIGGGVPLAALALFNISSNPQAAGQAPPLAWFGMFFLFGGLLGTIAGPGAVRIARAITPSTPATLPGRRQNAISSVDDGPQFDAFLSHNSRDKPAVRALYQSLQDRGLRIWLDEEQLIPGRPWQQELERIIGTTRTAVVVVGKDGLGPWEVPEMRACLSECVKRGMPVIPVLLPDAARKPELPLFLEQFTWVDFHDGDEDATLERLVWGITGVRPEPRRS